MIEPCQSNVEAGKDIASAITCKRCTSSNRKLGDRASEFIESTLTLQIPSPLLAQRCTQLPYSFYVFLERSGL